jgi:hypothetical protein
MFDVNLQALIVGARLHAKTFGHLAHLVRSLRSLRGQARSYRDEVGHA